MIALFRSGIHDVLYQFVVHSFAFQTLNTLAWKVVSKIESSSSNYQQTLFVKRARGFNRGHAHQMMQVEDVAAFVGTSSKTLQRHFHSQLGRSVAKKIRSAKYRNCTHQLLMGYSVNQVPEYSGIHDPSQFSNAFKREIGESPKQFQQKHLQMSR
jgi:AraC-like DNA-binding protein